MRTNILSDIDEPTDEELDALMLAVSLEVKRSYLVAKEKLNSKVIEEIALAQARYKIKQNEKPNLVT